MSYEIEVRILGFTILENCEFSRSIGYPLRIDMFPKGFIPFLVITVVVMQSNDCCIPNPPQDAAI